MASNALSMTLLLLAGTDRGPKTAAFGDWHGQAIYSPAESASEILTRSEFDKAGVYVLKLDPKDGDFQDRVYIGQSSVLRERLKTHVSGFSKKPFSEFVAFSSTNNIVNVGTVSYLEHRLVAMANQARNCEVENKQKPRFPQLPESDRINMESYLRRMKIILPIFGFNFLQEAVVPSTTVPEAISEKTEVMDPVVEVAPVVQDLFKVVGNIAKAFMYLNDGRFVVTKGSQANKKESKSIGKNWVLLRRKLVQGKILIDKGSHYEFTEDTFFTSASAASSVVLGRQTSGPISWTHLESNLKYAEMLERGLL